MAAACGVPEPIPPTEIEQSEQNRNVQIVKHPIAIVGLSRHLLDEEP